MRCAQGLYERGFITYMRTDSVQLSEQAINAARKCVSSKYGDDIYLNRPDNLIQMLEMLKKHMRPLDLPESHLRHQVKQICQVEIYLFMI